MTKKKKDKVAVIGMSCRYPGANSSTEFWKLLSSGRCSVIEIPYDRWNTDSMGDVQHWCGCINDVSGFDNDFFRISPREARNMDPQQRILLEETWHCIEDAGISLSELSKHRTAVYVGVMAVDYRQESLKQSEVDSFACQGSYENMLANRVSYVFNLSGKSVSINAACASSLIALSDAQHAIESGECDYAIVAGVNLNLHPWKFASFTKAHMLSEHGRCNTFDISADGYVPGDGVGVFLLTSLHRAEKAGYGVYGIVLGSAVGHTGKTNSLTAPSVEAQQSVIERAWEDADIQPDLISYVETHGTGTSLGDPIEFEALQRAFNGRKKRTGLCALGSVKTNIGHLEGAAGCASLSKVLLMLHEQAIPPSIGINCVNPMLDEKHSPFEIVTELKPWTKESDGSPYYAGISSFGFGGANCHVVIEEYISPPKKVSQTNIKPLPIVISAQTSTALANSARLLSDYIRNNSKINIQDVCFTMLHGRSALEYRSAGIVYNRRQLIEFLDEIAKSENEESLRYEHWNISLCNLSANADKYYITEQRIEQLKKQLALFTKEYGKKKTKRYAKLLSKLKNGENLDTSSKEQAILILAVSALSQLTDNAVKPVRFSINNRLSKLTALVVSGACSLSSALEYLENSTSLLKLKELPRYELYDSEADSLFKPVLIDKKYISKVFDEAVNIDEGCVDDAYLLLSHQRTFMRFMKELEGAAQRNGIESLLEPNSDKEKLALKIASALSFARLSNKWNIKDKWHCKNIELIRLACSGVLTNDMLMRMVSYGSVCFDDMAAEMNERSFMLGDISQYSLLYIQMKKRAEKYLVSITKGAKWSDKENVTSTDNGVIEYDIIADKMRINSNDTVSLDSGLLTLWKLGLPVKWKSWYTEHYNTIRLPLYPFEHNSFWVYEQPHNLNFSYLDKCLSGHVILGHNIVPAAQIVLATAVESGLDEYFTAEGLKFIAPILFSKDGQTSIDMTSEDGNVVWMQHGKKVFSGAFLNGASVVNNYVDYETNVCSKTAKKIYALLAKHGYEYKEDYIILKKCNFADTGDYYSIDNDGHSSAAILDSMFQAALYSAFNSGIIGEEYIYLPYTVTRLTVCASLSKITTVYVASSALHELNGDLLADIYAFDEENIPVVGIEGAVMKRVAIKEFCRRIESTKSKDNSEQECTCFNAVWKEKKYIPGNSAYRNIAVVCADSELREMLCDSLNFSDVVNEYNDIKEFEPLQDSCDIILVLNHNDCDDIVVQSETAILNLLELLQKIAKCSRKEQRVMVIGDGSVHCGMEGMLRCAAMEIPDLVVRYIAVTDDISYSQLNRIVLDELKDSGLEDYVQYINGFRYVQFFERQTLQTALLPRGVCVITGGAGGLGLLTANELSHRTKSIVTLIGRSPEPNSNVSRMLAENSLLRYYSCDVTDEDSLKAVLQQIREQCGEIVGVIHAAGLIRDSLLIKKSKSTVSEVLAPKMRGIANIDRLTASDKLEYFVAFSSIVSVSGNVGQCDYAAANAFMNDFMERRRFSGRSGRSISIAWTLWRQGNMGQQKAVIESFENRFGTLNGGGDLAVDTIAVLLAGQATLAVITSNSEAFSQTMKTKANDIQGSSTNIDRDFKRVQDELIAMVSEILEVPSEELSRDTDLRRFGMESIMLNEMAEQISKHFDVAFDAAMLFEKSSINSIAAFLTSNMSGEMIDSDSLDEKQSNEPVITQSIDTSCNNETVDEALESQLLELLALELDVDAFQMDSNVCLCDYGMDNNAVSYYIDAINDRFSLTIDQLPMGGNTTIAALCNYISRLNCLHVEKAESAEPIYRDCDVAIIGMSGRFPGSPSIEEFWNNLIENRLLISEVPHDRWDWKEMEEEYPALRWGGFLDDIRSFDAAFFKISGVEAGTMDPQQRMILEESWMALEDAGIVPDSLSGSDTGVFIGIANNDYDELIISSGREHEAHAATGTFFSVLANRVSYFYDLHGPSIAIDTACSSSLVAVHEAVKAITSGDCKLALVGGVNVLLTKRKYISFSSAHMLSPDGRCKTFDESANGYVRGEGAGMIILKSARAAVEDNDPIYAIIKGSAVNHGGFSGSLTKPNAKSQMEVVLKACDKAGFAAPDIDYIETHGTGTRLGDPVEVNGLKKAFEQLTSEDTDLPHSCYLGAVKANIGHLESASGIAGLIKLVLVMQKNIIPANINCTKVNSMLHLEQSPFKLPLSNIKMDRRYFDDGQPIPHRGGVSGFGFGGVNAHVAIEEYMFQPVRHSVTVCPVVVLSAHTEASLAQYIKHMADYFDKISDDAYLDSLYTLQCGRAEMEYRIAFVAENAAEAARILRQSIDSTEIVRGYVQRNSTNIESVEGLFTPSEAAQMWVSGKKVNWNLLQKNARMCHMQHYCFDRRVFWTENEENVSQADISENTVDEANHGELLSVLQSLSRGEIETEDVMRLIESID